MPLQKRIDFIKELLPKKDEEDEEEMKDSESNSSKALKFLNALELSAVKELTLAKRQRHSLIAGSCSIFSKFANFCECLESSVKSLMESVALITPSYAII